MKLSLSPRLNDSRLCQHVRAGNSQNYPRNEILSTGCETFRVTGSFVFSQSLSAGAEFIPQSANVIVKLKSRAVAVRLNVNSTCRPLLCLKLNLKNQSSLSGKLYTCIGRIVCNVSAYCMAGGFLANSCFSTIFVWQRATGRHFINATTICTDRCTQCGQIQAYNFPDRDD